MSTTLALFLVALTSFSFSQAMPEGRLLRFPDVTKDKIVFSYGGDLWLVGRKPGRKLAFGTLTER